MVDTFNRLQGARATLSAKEPVRAATTAQITLNGFQTVDGVTYGASDNAAGFNMRILVKDQTDSTQNGIYTVQSGDWARSKDFDGNTDFVNGSWIYVTSGTVSGGRVFIPSAADPASVGTKAIAFSRITLDNWTKHGADIAASSMNLDSATGDLVDVTGTGATISSIVLAEGRERIVRFTAANTLQPQGTLILPGGQAIATAAGDYAMFRGYASGVVRCVFYIRADGHYLTTLLTTLASAATTDLGVSIAQCYIITGTAAITSFGATTPTGAIKLLEFTGAASLTYNAASMILPGAQNIALAAGDCAIARHEGSGNWRVMDVIRGNSHPLIVGQATIASAGTTDLGSVREQSIVISGVVSITSFGSTAPIGAVKFVEFSGSLTLTFNGASLILPGGANIQTSPGDTLIGRHEGSGNWRVMSLQRSSPQGILSVNFTSVGTVDTSEDTLMSFAVPANTLGANGNAVRVSAWGTASTDANTKRMRLYFGNTVVADTGSLALATTAPSPWKFDSMVVRASSAAESAITTISGSSLILAQSVSASPAEATTITITIKVTGLSSVGGSGAITQNGMVIELLRI